MIHSTGHSDGLCAPTAGEFVLGIFEAAPLPAALVTAQGMLAQVNERFCAAVGARPEGLLDRSLLALVAAEDQEVLRDELQKVLSGTQPRTLLLAKIQIEHGESAPVRVSASRVKHRDGDRVLVILDLCSDWDDNATQMAERLEQQRDRWQEAEQARDTFLSIACHELKTPLSALQLQVQNILRMERGSRHGRNESSPLASKIGMLKKTLDRLTQLIDNLLDISRLRLGRLALHFEDVDMVEVVRDAAVRAREDVHRAGCTVRFKADGSIVGHWDRLRLEQIVTNLLQNACKYGRGEPIEMRVERTGSWARFVIHDGGIGIAPEDHERIFEPFERAAGSGFLGFGLGLWIVRQFVQALGGRISVESTPGAGSTFVAELPLEGPRVRELEIVRH
jgi:PAS domain S-box-containing protein